jgi:RNA recognition motif-containing protein
MVESFEESGKRLRVNPDGTLKSKGFGFVEFTEHIHALAALRKLNNNPEYAFAAFGGQAVRALRLCYCLCCYCLC